MRYQRTAEAEAEFVSFLERVNRTRKTMFTTRLLNALNSFLPSVVDPVLKRDSFAVHATIKDLDLSRFNTNTQAQRNAAKILADLQALHQTTRDIFTYDKTNTIESFFNDVKGRTPKDSPRLIDIYNAVSFTETQSLARHNPSPRLCHSPSSQASCTSSPPTHST